MVVFVTPAVGELLFFGTLVFCLGGQFELRTRWVSLFAEREAKLRFLKIMNDVEKNLAGYLAVVTIINVALGTTVAIGAFLLGLPNPIIFGVLAAVLNYIPYVGPAIMVVMLFGVGLVTFPSLGHALLAPLGLVALTTAEGHFITPTVWSPGDAQSAVDLYCACVLALDVGTDRNSCRPPVDRRNYRFQSFISA